MKYYEKLITIKSLERINNTANGGPQYKGVLEFVNSNYGPDDSSNFKCGRDTVASYCIDSSLINEIIKIKYHYTQKGQLLIDYIYR